MCVAYRGLCACRYTERCVHARIQGGEIEPSSKQETRQEPERARERKPKRARERVCASMSRCIEHRAQSIQRAVCSVRVFASEFARARARAHNIEQPHMHTSTENTSNFSTLVHAGRPPKASSARLTRFARARTCTSSGGACCSCTSFCNLVL